ncbi:hypothetical protein ACTJJB_02045 [Chitinophaga sp. 22536]
MSMIRNCTDTASLQQANLNLWQAPIRSAGIIADGTGHPKDIQTPREEAVKQI